MCVRGCSESDLGEPAAKPRPDAESVYSPMVDRYDALEQRVIAMGEELFVVPPAVGVIGVSAAAA